MLALQFAGCYLPITMAKIIPSWHNMTSITNGEKRLAQRLESKLEDDYLIWFDVAIGKKHQHPDFIILHPNRGILVLEVKDWKQTTILSANRQEFKLLTPGDKVATTKNPINQARSYVLALERVLKQDSSLVAPKESRYQGNLIFPYGYGVVLTNIRRAVFYKNRLDEVIPENLVICQDEMLEDVDPGKFQEQLWQMWPRFLNDPLNSKQIDRIRALIFPEIVMPSRQLSLFLKKHPLEKVDFQLADREPDIVNKPVEAIDIPTNIMKVMDLQQEKLARDLGDGHRVIHGVAGSGKTMILNYRCQHLARQQPTKPILVLCFNVVLAAKLQESIYRQEYHSFVQVYSFHKWLSEQCHQNSITKPKFNEYLHVGDYLKELEKRVFNGITNGTIPTQQYSSVLIDEGHDLQASWLQIISQMPENKSLLLLYDDAQNLYLQEKKQGKFTFKSVGIEAIGRTKILDINYRNTNEVLGLAYRFAKAAMESLNTDDEDIPMLIQPNSAGRHGQEPQLVQFQSFADEVDYLSTIVKEANQKGILWSDVAILYRERLVAQTVESNFKKQLIPIRWLNKDADSRQYDPQENSIKLVTMHSSKGLEFPLVIMPGLGYPGKSPIAEAMRLLYVAMTRSTDQLIMSYHQENNLVKKLKDALNTDLSLN